MGVDGDVHRVGVAACKVAAQSPYHGVHRRMFEGQRPDTGAEGLHIGEGIARGVAPYPQCPAARHLEDDPPPFQALGSPLTPTRVIVTWIDVCVSWTSLT